MIELLIDFLNALEIFAKCMLPVNISYLYLRYQIHFKFYQYNRDSRVSLQW